MPHLTEGWNWLINSNREHYFGADGRSLCGRWMVFGSERKSEPTIKPACKTCEKKLTERKV